MSTGYQIKVQDAPYYLTLQVVDWVDIFTRDVYKRLIIDNLRYCQQNKGFEVFAYVIMTNHIHIIVRSLTNNLSGTIRDFKSYTSKELLKQIALETESRRDWMLDIFSKAARQHERNSQFQLWSHENHAEQLWSNEFICEKIDYIHQNPVRAGIVSKPEDYIYSSARNYAGMEVVLDVVVLTRKWKTFK
ncbi:MAG TPA: transposase [Bacteroidales bacterium]